MTVDDRLDTVLHTHAAGQTGLNTQFRQLVDLLGRAADPAWTDRHVAALHRIDDLHAQFGDAGAAVLVGHCTLRSPRLIRHLADRGPRTALAAIGRARLSDGEWLDLVPVLPIHARGALRHRRDLTAPVIALLRRLGIDDHVLTGPDAPQPSEPAVAQREPVAQIVSLAGAEQRSSAPPQEGIGAIVRRIEAFRRHQDDIRAEPGQTRLPFADEATPEAPVMAIDIAIDGRGAITAAQGVDPALLIGHRLFAAASPAATAWVDAATLRAFCGHQPVLAGHLLLDGAPRIAGLWRIDAVPRFGSHDGQFHGYHARLRRAPLAAQQDPLPDDGSDSLQQLLHELRTPINAIQGFAELIQQQVLGPTPHEYRALAASIAADAARMLAGFEDVERLVRFESGRTPVAAGEADLATILAAMAGQLEPLVAPRNIRLNWTVPDRTTPIAIDTADAERLIWRLLSTLAAAAAPGERLTVALDHHHDDARVTLTLPAALAQRDDAALFAPDPARGNTPTGMLGHGFALRLVAAEVRAAGGHMHRPGGPGTTGLELTLPLLTVHALDQQHAAF